MQIDKFLVITFTFLRSDHKMVKKDTNIYLPNSANFFDSVLQKTVLLYLCEYTCVEFE